MTDLITQVWSALRDAGLPEVMLFLPDGSAYRCHWNDTSLIGSIRVALLADQDRKIVRIMPIEECKGIGIASPKRGPTRWATAPWSWKSSTSASGPRKSRSQVLDGIASLT
ncbi:MAG: hypothetical protein ACXVBB_17195 [Isosphaeraceae bacterium]